MIIRKTFRFEASHILPRHPGKCNRLHGHSWVLHVSVEGPVNPLTGFVRDYGDISGAFSSWIDNNLDHRHLGADWTLGDLGTTVPLNIPDKFKIPFDFRAGLILYPSSENILWWLGEIFQPFVWHSLALEETCTSYAELSRKEFDASVNQK